MQHITVPPKPNEIRKQHITVLLKPNEIINIFLKRNLLVRVVEIYVTVVHLVPSVMGIYPGNILMSTKCFG